MKIVTIELTAAVDAAGTLQTFYLSDQAYMTNAASTPAKTNFDPTLLDPGELDLNVFADGKTTGGAELKAGEIVIQNVDGLYDAWLDYGFDGRTISVRYVDLEVTADPVYPTDFTTLFTGVMDNVVGTADTLAIRIKDKQSIFDKQFLIDTYRGDNVLPAGVEGVAADLKGALKGRILAFAENLSPPCINTSKLLYRVSHRPCTIILVSDRGASLTAGSDYSNADALMAAVISSGSYATCNNEGLFRLGAAPAGLVTANAKEQACDNLLLYARHFDNAAWTKSGITVTADQTAAPDESVTADKLGANAGTAVKTVSQAVNGGVWTSAETVALSAYVKAGNLAYPYLTLLGSANNYASAVYDLANQTVSQTSVGATSGTIESTSITPLNDGWFFITLVARVTAANPTWYMGLALAASGNTFSTSGQVSIAAAGTEYVYAWHGRADPGYTANPWEEGAVPLYAENLVLRSQDLDNGAWTQTSCTVTADVTTAPGGGAGPDQINVGSGATGSLSQSVAGLTAGKIYTASVWFKTGANITAAKLKDAAGLFSVTINPVTQAVTAASGTTLLKYGVEKYSSTWTRVWAIFTATATTTTFTLEVGPASGAGTIIAWNAQLNRYWTVAGNPSGTKGVALLTQIRTPLHILKLMALKAGVRLSEIDHDALVQMQFDTINDLVYQPDYYVSGDETYLDIMNKLADGLGLYFGFDLSGLFSVGQWSDPNALTATASFDEALIGNDYERQTARDMPLPIWRATINYEKNWTVQTTDLASGVSAGARAQLAQEWRAVVSEDASIKKRFLQAGELSLEFYGTPAPVTEALRRLNLHKVRRDSIEFGVPMTAVRLAQVVSLTLSRFGLSAGKNMRLQRIRLELKTRRMRLTAWG